MVIGLIVVDYSRSANVSEIFLICPVSLLALDASARILRSSRKQVARGDRLSRFVPTAAWDLLVLGDIVVGVAHESLSH